MKSAKFASLSIKTHHSSQPAKWWAVVCDKIVGACIGPTEYDLFTHIVVLRISPRTDVGKIDRQLTKSWLNISRIFGLSCNTISPICTVTPHFNLIGSYCLWVLSSNSDLSDSNVHKGAPSAAQVPPSSLRQSCWWLLVICINKLFKYWVRSSSPTTHKKRGIGGLNMPQSS